MRIAIIALALTLAGCASQIGSIAGTSTITLPCGSGTVSYSAGIVPQMQPVTASCTIAGVTDSASITPGVDIATIAALVKQNMAAHQ